MIKNSDHLLVGAARGAASHSRTVQTFTASLRRICEFRGCRLLDVGCGDGTFTRQFAEHYTEVHGIDVQDRYLRAFQESVSQDKRFAIHNMSASQMSFPDAYFDTIMTLETFEHIPDIETAARECARVLRPGGELVITVPNRLFPFENHGIKIGDWRRHGRIPLLPWIPSLHDRWALARVFTVRDLDTLFGKHALTRRNVRYLWPTFEHGGNRFQKYLKPLFPLMRQLEESPVRMFGTSIVAKYVRS